MQFSVLGPLAVFGDDDLPLSLGGPRQRSVLALLLLDPGRVVAAENIVTEIWGDEAPDGARDSLYTYVSNLRGVVGRNRISRVDSGYRLDLVDTDTVDSVSFARKLARARRLLGSDPTEAGSLIDTALSSWRGRPYEGLEDLASVLPETVRLDELRLGATEDRIEAELLAGGTPDVGDVATLSEQYPYRERLWGLLGRSLYRTGRQAEALRTFTRLRQLLGEELGIEPSPALARVEEQILLQDPALDAGDALPPSNLPTPVSSFVGRVDELVLLDKAIHEHRLVTVVAPGGAGKTRLAIESGQNVRGSFPDGVWLVDLASVSQADEVIQAVAATLQVVEVPGEEIVAALARRLSSQRSLLVFDNCEHVVAAAGDLAIRLLETAPALKILATSREPLGRPGEFRFLLTGLGTAAERAWAGDAEQLFEQRATEVRPDLIHDDGTRLAVTSICRHLDGMPLAIELAAARVDTLSPAEIDRHLSDRFSLLRHGRADRPAHQSLQASLDWSYSLLTPAERSGFDYLGIFSGPFGVLAAGAVTESAAEVGALDRLRRLVNVSLVQVSPQVGSQYRLLETVRMYAMDHLNEGKLSTMQRDVTTSTT